MGTRTSFRRVPSQHVHEQLTRIRTQLGVLKVKLGLRVGGAVATYIEHVEAADKIAEQLQRQILPPYEPETQPAVETDLPAGDRDPE